MKPQTPKPRADRSGKTPQADWLSWSLHLIFGMFVGAGMGMMLARMLWEMRFIGPDQIIPVISGVSLLLAAFTSRYADRVWLRHTIFDPEAPPQSGRSRRYSIAIGGIGTGLILLSLAWRLGDVGWPSLDLSLSPIKIFILLPGLLMGYLGVRALRTGTAICSYWVIEREESPWRFWWYVTGSAIAAIYSVRLFLFK